MTVIEGEVGFDPRADGDFRTDAIRGGVWTMSSQVITLMLMIAATMILSRLLPPEDYGLYAVVLAVTAFISLFKDLGLGLSILQAPMVTQAQASALFWLNLATGGVLTALTIALAPLVGWLYGDRRLTFALCGAATSYLAIGLGSQSQALLRRQLRLDVITQGEIAGATASYTMAIIAAWLGAHYWALVLMTVVKDVVVAGVAWFASAWRPDPPARVEGVGRLLKVGGDMTALGVMQYFATQLDNLLVGWYWGAAALGFYAKAYQILLLPLGQLSLPVSAVAHATLSRLRDQPARYFAYLKHYLLLSTGLGMPVVVFMFVAADNVILVVLGAQWRPVIPIFRALAPAGFLMMFTPVLGWLALSLERTRRQIVWNAWSTALTVVSFVIGLSWGPIGVASGFSLSRALVVVPNLIYCCHKSPVRWTRVLAVARYPVIASLVSGILTWLIAASWRGSEVPALGALMAEALTFAGCYAGCWLVLPSGRDTVTGYVNALSEIPYMRNLRVRSR